MYGQDPSEDTKSDPGHGMLDNDSPMWASDHRAIMLTLTCQRLSYRETACVCVCLCVCVREREK